MTLTPTSAAGPSDELMLGAYLDGELDAAAALRFERRLQTDVALRADYERRLALRSVLRSPELRERADAAFRARLSALASPDRAAPRRNEWMRMAATAILSAGLASVATLFALRPPGEDAELADAFAGHRQMLLAAAPVEVETSDRHTVKPWFDAKLALSPKVVDLAEDGYPLLGGRTERIEGALAPALVYRRHNHLISLVQIPKRGSKDRGQPSKEDTRNGYLSLEWPGDDFDCYAISDVAPEELRDFVEKWRKLAS